ncbi:IS1595 family transposase [Seohaeicola nanhaiensis]|uniref:IS1595 family transposase n=1 Tax=Seohaeicola nanhaiensis TaxID=1387282 RepID=A0ABV9KNL8_9RHOB
MSVLSKAYMYDEAAAFAHVEAMLWPNGPVCPHCGNCDKVYDLKGVRSKPSKKNPEGVERHGLKKCAECRKQFTVRIGTIFEESHMPLHKWLQAIHLMVSSKKGISAHQMHRVLEVTYKTAWFLEHRIREAMRTDHTGLMGSGGGVVEADETFIGKDPKMMRYYPKGKKIGPRQKMKVLALVDRTTGRVRSQVIDHLSRRDIGPIIKANVATEARMSTDEASYYRQLDKHFAEHMTVNHGAEEYVRGEAHTNTLEGYFSIFKRGMKGVYQHCSKKHLHRYAAEFEFRYNNRVANGVDDTERAAVALSQIVGKRVLYRDSLGV